MTVNTCERGADAVALARAVAVRLFRLGGNVRDLRISVLDEGLVLSGRTHSYYAKQLAQHAAMDESGRPVAINAITVS